MKHKLLTLAVFALIAGCTPKDAAPGAANTTGSNNPTQTTGSTESPRANLADLPANLKHDGYEYYGLGNTKSLDVSLKAPDVPVSTGGVSAELQKIENGKAYFEVVRTGAIADTLGNNSVEVDSTGVYLTGTTLGTITPDKFLALPADLSPGKTWTMKNKVSHKNGSEIAEDSVYKVEGMRDVKTASGTQKALLVTSTGTANISEPAKQTKAKYSTKSWYVKGLGAVRIEITLTVDGQPPRTVTVEQNS